jgi:capsular exopolysaccharide synthesis family protein
MEPIDLLRAILGRWRVIVACAVLAGLAGAVTAVTTKAAPVVRKYVATAVLVPTEDIKNTNLEIAALLTTNGEVPKRVAEQTGFKGPSTLLASQVDVLAEAKSQSLKITAKSTEAKRAADLANTFSSTLLQFLGEKNRTHYDDQLVVAGKRVERANAALDKAEDELSHAPPDQFALARAKREARAADLSSAFKSLQDLQDQGVPKVGLQVLQEAQALPIEERGFQPPRSRTGRTVAATLFGLLLGVGIAFTLERVDVRVRSAEQAESVSGLPVLSEVPHIPRSRRRGHRIVASTLPLSPAAAAFRLARTALGSMDPQTNGNGSVEAPKTILVTSPGPKMGKTTITANLAAVFAETGRRVIVVSADLRHPAIHRYLDVPDTPGLVQALSNGASMDADRLLKTPLRGVWALPSGGVVDNPAGLLSRGRIAQALGQMRRMADVVLIDTPSLLDASDAAQLLPQVDAVIVSARAGRTSAEAAKRTGDFLRRMHVARAGVILNGARRIPGREYGRGYGSVFSRIRLPLRRTKKAAVASGTWE